ncbi:bifunctional endoribonuclease/protein kinase ire1 [Scheffersomyces spartinae]|uniref:non-specific serine/threonine protein kinase n=1 Tax=Scheffersomyces spartinae TaxID=45513 RepID=A0A9P8AKQ1_9ASCO|nr:bifunctional endoribonuclease/protein kinase ire1 [Scheffersomyces spartinae]KAG7195332.1 bifunctional endoribonuclease/protein kinase ire1 [Scheffersomyces spartinae]
MVRIETPVTSALVGTTSPYLQKNSPSMSPIDPRSINDYSLKDMILVSDVDGNLQCLERTTGALMWRLPLNEPLVNIESNNTTTTTATSTNNNVKDNNTKTNNIVWFVEPHEKGSLYYFTPEFGLNKLPTSIQDLVLESPFSLSGDDKIYTGTRKTSLFTINIHTGEIVNSFGKNNLDDDKCPLPHVHYNVDNTNYKSDDYIMLGKTTYELSIYSKANSNVVWNVNYTTWGPNNIDNDLITQNKESIDKLYFTPFHDKSILAVNRDLGTPAWVSKLPSLAVSVFDIFYHEKSNEFVVLPHPLHVLNDLQIQNEHFKTSSTDLVFLNKTVNGNQWFAMSYLNYPTLIKSAPISNYQLELYKLERSFRGTPEILQSFSFEGQNDPLLEKMVSGIHRAAFLNVANQYQPTPKFTHRYVGIGDGSNEREELEKSDKSPLGIIDGIKFSNSQPTQFVQPEEESFIPDRSKEIATREPISIIHQTENLSMSRRVFEDVIVILSVVGLFVILSKATSYVQRLKLNINNNGMVIANNDSEIPSLLDKDEKDTDDVVTKVLNVEDLSSSDGQESEFTDTTKEIINAINDEVNITCDEVPTVKKNNISKKVTFTEGHTDDEEKEDNENNTEAGPITKKKRKRGSRGGRRSKNKGSVDVPTDTISTDKTTEDDSDDNNNDDDERIITKSLLKSAPNYKPSRKKLQIENNLIISDKILGYGSHGTVVYEGTFENRPVAVKRMLLDFYHIANHEVRLLQESDDHPNVVRYFCSQTSDSEKFLYIALELCKSSLEDVIEKPKNYSKTMRIQPPHVHSLLFQLVNGLDYLHSLKIVHRDLKPQNILVGDAKLGKHKSLSMVDDLKIRLLISDFGLCKKLDNDQSSFRATTHTAPLGTTGWRAPELLLLHDLLEISPETIESSNSNLNSILTSSTNSTSGGRRLTKAIDIFSLGCVYFYILTNGQHPYGDRYLREANIIQGNHDLSPLNEYCVDDQYEAIDLVSSMISFDPSKRPPTSKIMKHPFFWSVGKKLDFLLKVSDRFEIERRDPPSELLLALEDHGFAVHGGDWCLKFDDDFMNNLGKYRKYHPEKLMDLLRALRNKYHHYNDMPPELQAQMTPLPHGFYGYFNSKFPRLLMEIYQLIQVHLQHEHIFGEFY